MNKGMRRKIKSVGTYSYRIRDAEKKEGSKLYEVKSKMLSRWRKSFRGKAATMKKIFGCAVVSTPKARRWEAIQPARVKIIKNTTNERTCHNCHLSSLLMQSPLEHFWTTLFE